VTGFGAVDPAQILTEGDLRQALAQLVAGRRHSMRAVERETGVSKTTMYEMLKGSRQLRHTTFTKIINFYAAEAADAWQAAWHRVHADGRSSASAAQSASVSARPETARRLVQLPADTPSFTGRQDELALIDRRLSGAVDQPTPVLCAIDGMGGVGKTALAVHAAHRNLRWFPDGCLFLDLHGHSDAVPPVDPLEAIDRLLRALDVPGERIPPGLADRVATYLTALAGKRLLIVLDNAASADQVGPLLPGSPGCGVLITSRKRLVSLDDAEPITIDVLAVQYAVALFEDVAGPERTAGADDAVRELVELCGGLPLAIRIAASRLRHRSAWTVGGLVARLSRQRSGLAEFDDGKRSVSATLTLSYRSLTADQRGMFTLLGLTPGPDIDVFAAAALAGCDWAVADRLLEDLLDAHLLVQRIEGRYEMHDLIRRYSADRAQTDEVTDRSAALNRLFDHWLATAAAAAQVLYPGDPSLNRLHGTPASTVPVLILGLADARTWLDAERVNLVAAAGSAAESGRYALAQNLAAVLRRHLDICGYYADAAAVAGCALSAARATGDRAGEANALNTLAAVDRRLGRYQDSLDHVHEALTIFRAEGDRSGEAAALNDLGNVYWHWGRYPEALRHYRQALAIWRANGDKAGEGTTLSNIGAVYWQRGRHARALRCYHQALALRRTVRDRVGQGETLNNLGLAYERQGDLTLALGALQEALAIHRELGSRANESATLTNLGNVYRGLRRYPESEGHLQRALDIAVDTGNTTLQAEALNCLGDILRAVKRFDEANTRHTAALELARRTGDQYELAHALDGLAWSREATGRTDEAHRLWSEALDVYDALGVPDAEAIRGRLNDLDPAR